MKTAKHILAILICLAFTSVYSQTDKAVALAKAQKGIKLVDEGRFDEALGFLKEAQQLDPDNYTYSYEIGYLYFIKKDYKKSIEIYTKVVEHKDVTDQAFQMLGSLYDYTSDTAKAFQTYKQGLKKFPNSGKLYLEIGTVYWGQKQYDKAIPYYEKGIEVDPSFSSNYYRAARIYCHSTEEVWGMIYGEIFMNMERNSERTSEISKLLYDTYKSEIKFTDDKSFSVSFSKNNTITINDAKDAKNIKLPFGVGVYEPILMIGLIGVNTIDLNSLDKVRTNFVENYFTNDNAKKYPNILFDYQKKIKDAGHFEAYNHWLLMKGDEVAFNRWKNDNGDKWDAFIKWFTDHKMQVDSDHRFYRLQY